MTVTASPATYTLGTVQTPQGLRTYIAMRRIDGSSVTRVHLPDATYVEPDATGVIIVPSIYSVSLMTAGWSRVDAPPATVP